VVSSLLEARANRAGLRLYQALRDLAQDSQHVDHHCGDTPENCPVLAARQLLLELEGNKAAATRT
jgi:hypothetical protein